MGRKQGAKPRADVQVPDPVLLDEVDKELERRGHAFCLYADDCNVYVRSRPAGERVMELLRRLYANLRLRINETKSAVDFGVEPENPGLLILGSAGTNGEAAGGEQSPCHDEGERPSHHEAVGRAEHRTGQQAAE